MLKQTITLGGGCFWCLESALNRVEGVISAYSGYSNGHTIEPSYEEVCSGNTGHAEVVQVNFDADKLSLREVLEIFCASRSDAIKQTRQRCGHPIPHRYLLSQRRTKRSGSPNNQRH